MTRKFENQTERKGQAFVKTLETLPSAKIPNEKRNSFFRTIYIYIYTHEELESKAMRIEERERGRGI